MSAADAADPSSFLTREFPAQVNCQFFERVSAHSLLGYLYGEAKGERI
jgi:hypothetical protein